MEHAPKNNKKSFLEQLEEEHPEAMSELDNETNSDMYQREKRDL